ncbi:MAG: GNAT family N-acetyltransferase [Chloroflexi bacterium]|nr:GNAT family N-acetyltransferase [Chloroflexota bacterium]
MGDVWAQLARFRQVKTLPDGSRVLLRPLAKEDRQGLIDLFSRASDEDLEYFRDDARDPAVVGSWVDHLDLRKVYPLVAIVDGRVVGDFTLHFGKRYHRHLAWVRLFLDEAYRRRGIGTLMLCSLTDIARMLGLQYLYIEVVSTQYQVIKAIQELGFRHAVTLLDFFITSAGKTMDMAVFVLPLVDSSGEF